MSGPSDADLDDILNSALADFEEDELDNERHDHVAQQKQTDDMVTKMGSLMEGIQDPSHGASLEETFRQLSTGSGAMPDLAAFLDPAAAVAATRGGAKPKGGAGADEDADEDADLEKGVAKTLQNLANATEEMEGMETNQAEQMGEEMMTEMMKEFEKMGEKEDFQDVINGMMKQLLSKEVMYTPMKQICEKFPVWLAEKESDLSTEDYERYGRQYQFFQKIVAVYDTEPDNFPRLMELMQDMQECGQPPSEIIKELAPGLEFGPYVVAAAAAAAAAAPATTATPTARSPIHYCYCFCPRPACHTATAMGCRSCPTWERE